MSWTTSIHKLRRKKSYLVGESKYSSCFIWNVCLKENERLKRGQHLLFFSFCRQIIWPPDWWQDQIFTFLLALMSSKYESVLLPAFDWLLAADYQNDECPNHCCGHLFSIHGIKKHLSTHTLKSIDLISYIVFIKQQLILTYIFLG